MTSEAGALRSGVKPPWSPPPVSKETYYILGQQSFSEGPLSKEISTADAESWFEELIFTNKLFNRDKIPEKFKEVSALIHRSLENNNTTEVENFFLEVKSLEKFLDKSNTKIEFHKKGKDYLQKCLGVLYVFAEYISCFYSIKIENDTITSIDKRKLKINELLNCLEATKKLEDVKNGLTDGVCPQQNPQSLFHSSQKGYETNSTLSRIFSGELLGVLGYAIGSEGIGWDAYLPVPGTHMQQGVATVASDLVMMAGFGIMTSSYSSMGYKFNLQKMLFGDVYSLLDTHEKKKLKQLSLQTRLELKKFLPETLNFESLGFTRGKIYGWNAPSAMENEKTQEFTAVDAKNFFQKFINEKSINYNNLVNKFEALTPANQQICFHVLRTEVTNHNGRWGTLLDHLSSKLNEDERKALINFIHALQKKFEYKNPIPGELGGENGATNYVLRIMKTTPWKDIKIGTQIFSELLLNIYSCSLSPEQKFFLVNAMLSIELKGDDRGEFASGKCKPRTVHGNSAIGTFYTVTSVTSFIVSFFATPLAGAIIKAISNGVGAMSFGWLGLYPHVGTSLSHASKVKTLEEGSQHIKPSASSLLKLDEQYGIKENLQDYSIPEVYSCFLEALNKLKELRQKKLNKEENFSVKIYNIVESIKMFVQYFDEQCISQFVFEANHAEKNCPLFEIVETLLDVSFLKKQITTGVEKAEIKERAVNNVSEIIQTIYKKRNEQKIKEIIKPKKLTFSEMTEDYFNIFISHGFKNSATTKDKLLFSFQCFALLESMKTDNCPKDRYKNCESLFFKAVKDAAYDKSSLLYDLQKRNAKTYATRRVIMRACVDMATVGVFGILVALSICPFTSIFGAIGMAFFTAFLYGADFTGRKIAERLEYGTRIELNGKVIKRAYRNYEVIRSLVDAKEELNKSENNESENKPRVSAVKTLKNVSEMSLWRGFEENKKIIIDEFDKCLTWHKKIDNAKLEFIKNLSSTSDDALKLLRDEVSLILRQGFDKESAAISLVRAQRFILKCEHSAISLNDKRDLLCKITYQACLRGQLADIIQTKATWGSDQYLLADFALGSLAGSLGIFMEIPGLHGLYQSIDQAGNATQSLQQYATEFSSQVGLDTLAFTAWTHEMDVSQSGRTKTFAASVGATKTILSLFTPTIMEKEKEDKKKASFDEELKLQIEKKYSETTRETKNILNIQRHRIPSFRQVASMKKYEEQERSAQNLKTVVSASAA